MDKKEFSRSAWTKFFNSEEYKEWNKRCINKRSILTDEFGVSVCPHCGTQHTIKWIGLCRECSKPMIEHTQLFIQRSAELDLDLRINPVPSPKEEDFPPGTNAEGHSDKPTDSDTST